MGQSQSASAPTRRFDFQRTPFSTIADDGKITCDNSCSFTQYSNMSLTATEDMIIHCKVHDTMNAPIAFGLLPKSAKDGCKHAMVGHAAMQGSVGCHIDRDTVGLWQGGSRCFCGPVPNPNSTSKTVSMKFSQEKVTFYVDGKTGDCPTLELMETGNYELGLSMTMKGQLAEVFLGSPISFEDCWSAGLAKGPVLKAKSSMKFTFFTEETMKPQGEYRLSAHVVKDCEKPIHIGIMPADGDFKSSCQNEVVGMFNGTVACCIHSADSIVSLLKDGKTVFQATMPESCNIISLLVKDGKVKFILNEKEISIGSMDDYVIEGNFKFGVGLECEGQEVDIRGDGKPMGELLPQGLDATVLQESFHHLLGASRPDDLRWKDVLTSIDCDTSDRIAVGVCKNTATLFTTRVVECEEEHSVDIRILKNPPVGDTNHEPLMMVGMVHENTSNHERHHLGSAGLPASLGLTNRGDLVVRGNIMASGLGFQEGDIVTMALSNRHMSIKVNGVEAVSEIEGLGFKDKARWAISFSNEGQAVKLGSDILTEEENRFCVEKGVITSVKTTDASTVASDASHTEEWLDEEWLEDISSADQNITSDDRSNKRRRRFSA